MNCPPTQRHSLGGERSTDHHPLRWPCKAVLIVLLCLAGCLSRPTKESDTLANITQLTTGFARTGTAQFTGDMRYLIFQAEPPGEDGFQTWIAPLRRDESGKVLGLSGAVRVTPAGSKSAGAVVSPDGGTIILASTGRSSSRDTREFRAGPLVWVFPRETELYRVDGWESLLAVRERDRIVDLTQFPITGFKAYAGEPAIHPDGRWLVFATDHSNDPFAGGDVDLFAMRIDGSGLTRLTNTPGYDGGPAFSPDGRELLYRSAGTSNGQMHISLATVVFEGPDIVGLADQRQLTSTPDVHFAPVFHPGGRFVMWASAAVSSDTSLLDQELHIMRRSGLQHCRITFTPGPDTLPTFSPDGRYIVWTSRRTADGTAQLFMAEFKPPAWVTHAPPGEGKD